MATGSGIGVLGVTFNQSIVFKIHKYFTNRHLFYKYVLGAARTFSWYLFVLRKLPAPGFPPGNVPAESCYVPFLSAQFKVHLVPLEFLKEQGKKQLRNK